MQVPAPSRHHKNIPPAESGVSRLSNIINNTVLNIHIWQLFWTCQKYLENKFLDSSWIISLAQGTIMAICL